MKASPPPLSQQVIVITGASSGFGRGAALAFAAKGASVVLVARRGALLEALAEECKANGGDALAFPVDVSRREETEKVMNAAVERFGRIDTWINNAGVGAIGQFEDVPIIDHEQVLRTNLFGTLYGSYAAMQNFRVNGSGVLINVSSMLGRIPAPYYASYVASKSGVIGLTSTLRLELKQQPANIHVCLVLPMAMNTPFFEHAGNYTGHKAEPIPPVYDAQKVVETLIRLAEAPEDEVVVGRPGVLAELAHRVMPHLAEAIGAKDVQAVQTQGPVAPHTSGAVHIPVINGTGLHSD